MAVLGTGSWTLSSGPRTSINNKRKITISRWTLLSGSYLNGIKTPTIGQLGLVRNVENMDIVASATGNVQGMVWTFDRANRKLRAWTTGSASGAATGAGGRKPRKELTSAFGGSSDFRGRVMHIQAVGW